MYKCKICYSYPEVDWSKSISQYKPFPDPPPPFHRTLGCPSPFFSGQTFDIVGRNPLLLGTALAPQLNFDQYWFPSWGWFARLTGGGGWRSNLILEIFHWINIVMTWSILLIPDSDPIGGSLIVQLIIDSCFFQLEHLILIPWSLILDSLIQLEPIGRIDSARMEDHINSNIEPSVPLSVYQELYQVNISSLTASFSTCLIVSFPCLFLSFLCLIASFL